MGVNTMKKAILVLLTLMAVGMVFTACEDNNSTSGHYSYYDAPANR